jgi:hypothetical protein
MDPRNFFSGVKRRNLCKVAVACVIGAMLAAAAASAMKSKLQAMSFGRIGPQK